MAKKDIWLIFLLDEEGFEWLHAPFVGSEQDARKSMDEDGLLLYGPFESLDDSGNFLSNKVSERHTKMTTEWQRRKNIISRMNRKSTSP